MPKEKKNTWKPGAIKLLICTSVKLTKAVTTTGHEMDQRRCYSFCFFLLFLITIVVMQIVLNSCKLLVFKRYAMKRLRRLYSTVNVSESSRDDSSTHQIIRGDEAADVSPQSIITLYSSVARMKSNESKCDPNSFLIGDILLSCIPFENRAFSYLPFHFDKPFFVSCTCLHCISHCPKEKQY